jgi:hypothetical protein
MIGARGHFVFKAAFFWVKGWMFKDWCRLTVVFSLFDL